MGGERQGSWERALHEELSSDSDDDIVMNMLDFIHNDLLNRKKSSSQKSKHGGSRPGRRPNIDRERAIGHERILRDYYGVDGAPPIYTDLMFRRRHRMRRTLFMRIMDKVAETDPYFKQKLDACSVPGLSTVQKCTAALRMLCYGICADAVDEYVRIGESTALGSLKRFCSAVLEAFGAEYLREPTPDDVEKHMQQNAARGFVGMFGSLDCTHWEWKNCPVAWQGQYQDKDGNRSIVMEAIATQNLWIWHAYIGIPGSNNDINIIDRSPLMVNMMKGVGPSATFHVNRNIYRMLYLLVDGIYPDWPIFLKTISEPTNAKQAWYAKMQEALRKDVERCFGVLFARFHILAVPGRMWKHDELVLIWKACVCLHNMIVEDEEAASDLECAEELSRTSWKIDINRNPHKQPLSFESYRVLNATMTDSSTYFQLREDLVEHLWSHRGSQ